MKVKVGVDIVSLENFNSLLSEISQEKIFLPSELSRRDIEHLGGIFAAKEAVIKALTMKPGSWHRLEIIYEESLRPKLLLPEELIQKYQIFSYDLSISHDGNYAIATVVFLITS